MGDRARRVIELASEKAGWGNPLPAEWGRGIAYQATVNVTHVELSRLPMAALRGDPEVEVHIVTKAEPPTKVGEMAVPPIAPAVANAVFAATGTRLRTLLPDP